MKLKFVGHLIVMAKIDDTFPLIVKATHGLSKYVVEFMRITDRETCINFYKKQWWKR